MEKVTMDLERLGSMIKDIRIAMLSTVDETGAIYSRPMANQEIKPKEFDGVLYFFTKNNSPKVHAIEHDQHVNLAYSEPKKQEYVSVSGKAFISEDKALMEKLWNPIMKAWFPEGLEDPEICLIGVNIESAELWDAPSSKVVQMVGLAKALLTGKPLDHDLSSEKINL